MEGGPFAESLYNAAAIKSSLRLDLCSQKMIEYAKQRVVHRFALKENPQTRATPQAR
jgi:hypothetical protein